MLLKDLPDSYWRGQAALASDKLKLLSIRGYYEDKAGSLAMSLAAHLFEILTSFEKSCDKLVNDERIEVARLAARKAAVALSKGIVNEPNW